MDDMFNRNRVWGLLAKTIGNPIDFEKLKPEAIVLCKAENQDVSPAIFINHHLSRITGAPKFVSLESELNLLHTPKVFHEPTVLYRLDNVRIYGGGLWTKSRNYWSRKIYKNKNLSPVELGAATLVDNDLTSIFFGHWLHDFVPASLIGTTSRPSLALNRPNYTHAKDYECLFELDVIYANSGVVRELYFLHDVAQNSYKLRRYSQLRNQLADKLRPEDSKYTGVYIARGNSGLKRMLTNEQDLIDHLAKKGFDILYPEKMTPEMIVRRLWNASLVIAVEGSSIAHAIYTAAHCAGYLILMPPNRLSMIFKGILDALNNPFGLYICQPSQESDSFYIDSMSDIDKLIDLLREESARRMNF